MAYGIKTRLDKSSVNKVMEDFKNLVEGLKNLSDTNYITLKIKGFEQITKVDDELKKVNDTAKKTKDTFKDVDDSVKKTNDTMKGVENSSKKVGDGFKSASDGARTFSEQMGHVIKKVAEWTIGTSVVFGVINQIRDGFKFVAEFDSHITTMAMLTGKSRQEIQGMTGDMNNMAKALGTNTNEIANGYEVWLRAGETIKDTRELLKDTTKLGVISGDGSKKTSEYLIAIKNAYGKNIEQVEQYTDKVALLDSATATCASNINKAFVGVAQTAKQQGLSENFMLGSIATIQSNSKMNPESVGRLYKSVLLNIRKVKEEGKGAVSDLEANLNKHGIALRKNAKEWRNSEDILKDLIKNYKNLDGVTQSLIQQQIAGKTGAELFGIMAQQSDDLFKNIKKCEGATGTLDKKYEEYLKSTKGKMDTLKATAEGMWLSVVNSSVINKGIGGLTTLVNLIREFAEHNKLLGITVVALSVQFIGMLKNVNMLKVSLQGLKMLVLGLVTNPFIGWIVGIGAVITLFITFVNHMRKAREEQKKLNEEASKMKKTYDDAMKSGDKGSLTNSIKDMQKEQKKLNDLIAKQKEIQNNMKNHKPTFVTGGYVDVSATKLKETNEAIKKQTELLKKNGFHVDDNTGAIRELSQAENEIKVNGFFEHVQEISEEQIRYKQEIVGLWKEYQTLSAVENKNENQKQRLLSVTDDLKRYMSDLTITTDENGNVVIKNTELVGKQINMLDTENVSINDLIDVKIEHARQTEICETNMTNCVYSEVGARIQAYQDEINALNGLKSLMYGQAYELTGGDKFDSLTQGFGLKTGSETMDGQIKARQNEINELKNKEKEWNDRVAKIKNSFKVPKQPSHPNYTPSGGGGGRRSSGGGGGRRRSSGGGSGRHKSSGGGSGSHKSETQYKYDGKQESVYDATIKTINNSLDKSDKLIDKISQKIANLQSLESKSNFKDILAQENEKLEAQKEKLDRLKSAQSQADKMKNDVENEFKKNWSWMRNKDISSMSEKDFTDLYNKYYGQTMNFGTGDSAKKKEEAYKKGADLFKELKKNYEDASSLALDSGDKQLKLEQEINSTTKERLETQTQMFNEEEDRYSKRVSYSEYLRDVFNKTDEDRMKYTKQILEVNKDYQDKLYDHVNTLMAQKESVEENTAEWNIINQQIGEYQQKLIDTSKNIEDQKQAIKDLEWETQIKKYTELFNNLQDKMGDTHDKLELLMANNSNDYANRVKLMDEELTHSIEYNAQLRIANNQLQSQLNKLEKGTDEWTRVHDQIEEYNESIDTSTKSILDQQKAIANLQWETQLKRYTDILDAKKNDIDDLQAKLDIVNTKDKNDIGTKLALMESILSANENYLEQSEALRDNLVQQRDELQSGTAEWEKVNAKVKEYDNNIRNTTKSIEQHNSEILKVKWDFKIKQYTELLNARKDVISEIQNELDILNTKSDKENEDNIKKLAYMDKILQVNNDLLKKNTELRDELVEQRNNLKEGTADWEMINNKVKEYDNNINQTTKSIAQQNKAVEDLLKTRTRLLLESQKKNQEKKLDKDIFGMSEDEWSEYHQRKIDRLQREIDEANEFTNKYGKNEYTDDELNAKNLELDQAKKETYENIKNYKEVFDDIHNQRIKAIDDELKRLDDKNNKEKISEDREKRRLELEKLRLELENTRNQKNIQQLTKDKNGLYQFVYVADQKKINDLEQQIKTKEEDNVKWEQDLQDQEYRKKLEKEKKFEDDMMKAKNNFHSKENNKLQNYYQDMDNLVNQYLRSLKEKYNNNYVDILATLETQIEKEKNIKSKYYINSLEENKKYYKKQMDKLDDHYDNKLRKSDRYYRDEEKKLRRHYNDEVGEIQEHYDNLNNIIEVRMDDLKSIYSSKWDDILNILKDKLNKVGELNKQLQKEKEKADKYTWEQAKKDFLDAKKREDEDDAQEVRDKYKNSSHINDTDDADYTYSSNNDYNDNDDNYYSSSSSSNKDDDYSYSQAEDDFLDAKEREDEDGANEARDKYGDSSSSSSDYSEPSSSDINDFLNAKEHGDDESIDNIRDKYSSFDTGGYTGAWGKDGKLAILHEKELVLNKYQTKDILKASELLSRVNPLNNINMPKINMPNVSDLGISNKQPQVVKHVYQVDKIECPNVTNDSGINNMFEQFYRLSTQHESN